MPAAALGLLCPYQLQRKRCQQEIAEVEISRHGLLPEACTRQEPWLVSPGLVQPSSNSTFPILCRKPPHNRESLARRAVLGHPPLIAPFRGCAVPHAAKLHQGTGSA